LENSGFVAQRLLISADVVTHERFQVNCGERNGDGRRIRKSREANGVVL
jgi:hypothetical protein